MQYISLGNGLAVANFVDGFSLPYRTLSERADSGANLWKGYSHNNFDNPICRTDDERGREMRYWSEITMDAARIRKNGSDRRGRIHLKYVLNTGTEREAVIDTWAPRSGWYVLTEDGWFRKETRGCETFETLIPLETVDSKEEAMRRLEKKGVPPGQVSFFFQPSSASSDDRFVGRTYPLKGHGKFNISFDWRHDFEGLDNVGSRPRYDGVGDLIEVNGLQ